MPVEPYLARLAARLAAGIERLPDAERRRHADYLLAAQRADGGWAGREGESDLYYTGFGLRGLTALSVLTPEVCDRASAFLRSSLGQQTGVPDFFSLLYSALLVQAAGAPDPLANAPADWPERVLATLDGFRTPDGGYAKSPGSAGGSTYHTFLIGLCYELLGRSYPDRDAVVRFVRTRRRDDGGFVEVGAMRRSGSNPTAAAVGILQLADALDDATRAEVTEFLVELASDEGGLRANPRVPLADLLSTFTAGWTLAELGALDRLDGRALRRYAVELALPDGGFRGGLWDEGHDPEYTFYGLGVLAIAPEP
jgi:geranylgeranyl transferase type-2 subunit beta